MRTIAALVAASPPANVGAAAFAPSVFRNVSAYRFWLAFISVTASSESGGDR